jgi:hypothetical protein
MRATNDNSTGSNNTSWIELVSKQIIRQGMNEQQWFQHIHNQTYDVTCVSDDSNWDTSDSLVQTTIPKIETPIVRIVVTGEINDFCIWTWIFFPLGFVLLGILVY